MACKNIGLAYQRNPQFQCPALYHKAITAQASLPLVDATLKDLREQVRKCAVGMQGNHHAWEGQVTEAEAALGPETVEKISAIAHQNAQGTEAMGTSGELDKLLDDARTTLSTCIEAESNYVRLFTPAAKISEACSFAPLIPDGVKTEPQGERLVSAHTSIFESQNQDIQSLVKDMQTLVQNCTTKKATAESLIARAKEIRARVASNTKSGAGNSSDPEQSPPYNAPPSSGGPITTQPAKRGLLDSAKDKMGQALPGVLGAAMAGAGMLNQPKSDKQQAAAKPQTPPSTPKEEPPKVTAAASAAPEASNPDAAKTDEPKIVTGATDVTKQDALVKMTSGQVTKKQILDKDGNVIGEEVIAHDANGNEVKKNPADDQTEVASNGAGSLGSSGNDTPLGAVGSGGAESSGVALASGTTGGGRALAGDASQGYGASPYGGGHRYSPGLSSGSAPSGEGSSPLDSNIGANSVGAGESVNAGVQTVAARKPRRLSALPICNPNSKLNGAACQPIQKLRDDRVEREKGRINSDPNLNIESGRTRKR